MGQTAKRSVCLSGCSSPTCGDTHFEKAKTDERHHDARHKRGDDAAGVFQQPADNHLYKCRHNTATENHGQSAYGTNGDDGADEGKTRTLNAKHPRPHRPHAAALYESGDT